MVDIGIKLLSYIPIVIIFVGVSTNLLTFSVIMFNKDLRKLTSMIYLSLISITNTLTLFVWNLNNFLIPNFDLFRGVETLSMPLCKLFIFNQFFSLESSGFLLCIHCIDRFITICSTPGSFMNRLPFRTHKSAYLWSFIMIALAFIINMHIFIFDRKIMVKMSIVNTTNLTTEFIYKTTFDCYTYFNGKIMIYLYY